MCGGESESDSTNFLIIHNQKEKQSKVNLSQNIRSRFRELYHGAFKKSSN